MGHFRSLGYEVSVKGGYLKQGFPWDVLVVRNMAAPSHEGILNFENLLHPLRTVWEGVTTDRAVFLDCLEQPYRRQNYSNSFHQKAGTYQAGYFFFLSDQLWGTYNHAVTSGAPLHDAGEPGQSSPRYLPKMWPRSTTTGNTILWMATGTALSSCV
jgi:hypothetical protein